MRLSSAFVVLAAGVLAQDSPADGQRAANLDTRIQNAQDKCEYFMTKAFYCDPPSGKITKYIFRLNKVMYDAVHHYNIGKCTKDVAAPMAGYRKRRQADDLESLYESQFNQIRSEMDDEFEGKATYGGSTPKASLVNKLEGLCRKFMATVWNDPTIQDCPKLGAWENRSQALLDDMTAMKNICMNSKGADQVENGPYGG